MLTKDELDYLSKIPKNKKVSIKPFDLEGKKIGESIVQKIRNYLPDLEVLFMGSVALKIAETLQKIHKIDIGKFGEFNGEGRGIYETWKESLFSFLDDPKYKRATRTGVYGKDLSEKGALTMKELNKDLNYKPRSVLTHQDPTPENAIYYEDKITLVDWDNAKGSVWIEDLAWITFWMGREARRWFLDVYKPEEPLDLIEKVENVIHLRLAITLVPYYFYSTKNYKAVERMKRKLRNLIST